MFLSWVFMFEVVGHRLDFNRVVFYSFLLGHVACRNEPCYQYFKLSGNLDGGFKI